MFCLTYVQHRPTIQVHSIHTRIRHQPSVATCERRSSPVCRGTCRTCRRPGECRTEWRAWRIRYTGTGPRRWCSSSRPQRSCSKSRSARRGTLKGTDAALQMAVMVQIQPNYWSLEQLHPDLRGWSWSQSAKTKVRVELCYPLSWNILACRPWNNCV